jgi:hypothetical protein
MQNEVHSSPSLFLLRLVPKKFSCIVCGRSCDEDEHSGCDEHPSICDECICPCDVESLVNLEVELMQFPGVFDLLMFQTVIMGETRICLTVPRFQGVDLGHGKMRLEMVSGQPDALREQVANSTLGADAREALLNAVSKVEHGQPTYLCNISLTKEDLTAIGLEKLADAPWGDVMKPSEKIN